MEYQRRQITAGRQRWEDTERAQYYRAWFAGWERRKRWLKIATVVFIVQSVVWFALAWNNSPLHVAVFASMFVPAGYALYITIWSIKEL